MGSRTEVTFNNLVIEAMFFKKGSQLFTGIGAETGINVDSRDTVVNRDPFDAFPQQPDKPVRQWPCWYPGNLYRTIRPYRNIDLHPAFQYRLHL